MVVVIVKFALVAPLGTVTEVGVLAVVGLLLLSVTLNPLAGAAALKVTVPVEFEPPKTLAGFKIKPVRPPGVTVTTLAVVDPAMVAVTGSGVGFATALLEHSKLAVVDPPGITTV